MKNEDLIEIGFKELPHITITNSVIYDLGRRRQLSAGCVGTPNEMLFICEIDKNDDKKITDLVCLHNYDYDGYMTETKIQTIIMAITGRTDFLHAEPARPTTKEQSIIANVSVNEVAVCAIHTTDWYGKCLVCGQQVFERE